MSETYTGFRLFEVNDNLVQELHKEKEIKVWDKRLAFYPNMYVELKSDSNPKNVCYGKVGSNSEIIYKISSQKVSTISPRNREQIFAMDALMNDEVPVVVLTGPAGTGKAQPLDAKILTPNGWTTMGEIEIGTEVLTSEGKVSKVIGIFPQGEKDIYRVWFSDETFTECCEDHLWYTETQLDRDKHKEGSVKSLKDIKKSLRAGVCFKRNHNIPMVKNIEFNEKPLFISPYLMGLLLGDGSISIGQISLSTSDKEIVEYCNAALEEYEMRLSYRSQYDYNLIHFKRPSSKEGNYIKNKLIEYHLYGKTSENKFIPEDYKINSLQNRIALLQGLLDADGTIGKQGNITYTTTSQSLANDIIFLIQSLGGKAVARSRYTNYTYNGERRRGKLSFTIHLSLPNNIIPFRLSRKLNRIIPKTKYPPKRYIDRIEYIGKKIAQCILIDDPSHLYITDNFIVTHNTLITLAMALHKIEKKKYEKAIITKPMSQVGKYNLGILPGNVSEKFDPYLLNYTTNLEQFVGGNKKVVQDIFEQCKFEMVPIQLMRGASFNNSLIILDEAQVLNHLDLLTIGTRVGENSKIVIMGDLSQRDDPIAKEKTGIYKIVNDIMAKESPLISVVELQICERSATARFFANLFKE